MEGGSDAALRQILLVEDNASDSLVLSHALASMGFPMEGILHAETLAAALQALGSTDPDLAIVDLGLPDSRGADTVRRIRRAAPEVPLLVVSAVADTEAALRSLQEGADDYLVKGSWDAHSLDRAIRYTRERRRLRSAELRRASEVERAEGQLRSVVEANGDGMLIVDEKGVVKFANAGARRLVAPTGADIMGSMFGTPLLEAGATVELEGPITDDIRPAIEMRAAAIEWDGAPAHLNVLRDVTELRLLEERLRQSQKMEALGQLTGGIAHDFNNVLAVILNGTELLAEAVPAEHAEAHAELREIDRSARRAAGMVRRLLGFSRRGHLRFENVDIRRFTEDMLNIMRRMMSDEHRIHAVVEGGHGSVRADPAALQQIFLNIVANSRDAMPREGELRIEAGAVELDETHRSRFPWVLPGPYERVALTDTGNGMSADTLARIFEPFYTTKGAEAGTGLGMAMVYGLMKQHRGLVHVQSDPGMGTTVELFFPSAAASERPDRKPIPTSRGSLGATVLVIDDEPALRRGMQRVLTMAGYRVLTARDGREGVEAYKKHEAGIDLVISDLVMPKLGGKEVLAEIRREGSACPFLLTTGYGVDALGDLRGQNVSMLAKPWRQRDLLEAVRKAIDPRDAAPEAAG